MRIFDIDPIRVTIKVKRTERYFTIIAKVYRLGDLIDWINTSWPQSDNYRLRTLIPNEWHEYTFNSVDYEGIVDLNDYAHIYCHN